MITALLLFLIVLLAVHSIYSVITECITVRRLVPRCFKDARGGGACSSVLPVLLCPYSRMMMNIATILTWSTIGALLVYKARSVAALLRAGAKFSKCFQSLKTGSSMGTDSQSLET